MAMRAKKLKTKQQLNPDAEAWLNNDECGFFKFLGEGFLRQLWSEHGERLVEEHVAEFPGTRPARWYQFDAPEPRKRLGGIGTPDFEALCFVPRFDHGLPCSFISQWDVDYYTGVARDVHGKLINPNPPYTFKGVAIDPEDPPRYESQATYLERLGLFLPGEKRRIKKDAWTPDTIVYVDSE
jgi:hypothetical protein